MVAGGGSLKNVLNAVGRSVLDVGSSSKSQRFSASVGALFSEVLEGSLGRTFSFVIISL